MSTTTRTAGTLAIAATALGAGAADFEFVEVGADRGIAPYVMAEGMGGGVAAADYDDDGDVDLFVPNRYGVADQLYRNRGDGTFEEIAGAHGLDSEESSRAALWFDADGDGRLDLLVARDGWHQQQLPPTALRLLRQTAEGGFEDVTAAAGLGALNLDQDASHIGGLCAGDVDGDGSLDLCMSQWDGATYLFLNDGAGVFTDVSVESGVAETYRTAWQSLMHDVDGAAGPDIFVAVDFRRNSLWMNRGDATFADEAGSAGVDGAFNEMGAAFGDYDNDQDLDLYVTNITEFDKGDHNRLYRNDTADGVPAFSDVALDLGVDDTDWGWGVTFLDADRDGWLDLAVTNGFESPEWRHDQSRLFLNRRGAPEWFEDVSTEVGFDDREWGSSVVALDFDRDGDLDLVQTCNLGGDLRLLENRLTGAAAEAGYLVVKPRMTSGANVRAIGAMVRLTADGLTQVRPITCGTSLMGQEPAEAFFGLGVANTVDLVRVEWPDGRVTAITGVAPDQVLTVTDEVVLSCPEDLDGNGLVGFSDVLALLAAWGECPAKGECPADVDEDGAVTFGDLLVVLGAWGPCA